jgi:hypothetical protein
MRRRQRDLFDQPWVPIAAVIGVIAVIVIAVFFFMGIGGSSGQPAASGSSAASAGSSLPAGALSSTTINPAAIVTQPTVTVPANGVFVKVSYIGSFSGTYGGNGDVLNATDSGDRVYEIVNANGTISAKFKKTDSSTKAHDLTVEIWKNGKVLKFGTNASTHGEVSVDYKP